jgi:hypothetical protein
MESSMEIKQNFPFIALLFVGGSLLMAATCSTQGVSYESVHNNDTFFDGGAVEK